MTIRVKRKEGNKMPVLKARRQVMPEPVRGPRIGGQLPTADFSSLEKGREGFLRAGANRELEMHNQAVTMETKRNLIDLQDKSNKAFQKLKQYKGYDAENNYKKVEEGLGKEAQDIIGVIKNSKIKSAVRLGWEERRANFENASFGFIAQETRKAYTKTLEAEMQMNVDDLTLGPDYQRSKIIQGVDAFIKNEGLDREDKEGKGSKFKIKDRLQKEELSKAGLKRISSYLQKDDVVYNDILKAKSYMNKWKKDFTQEASARAWNMINRLEKAMKDRSSDKRNYDLSLKAYSKFRDKISSRRRMTDYIMGKKGYTAEDKIKAIKAVDDLIDKNKKAEKQSDTEIVNTFLKAVDELRKKQPHPNAPFLIGEVINTPTAQAVYNNLPPAEKKIIGNAFKGIIPEKTDDNFFNSLFIKQDSDIWDMPKPQALRIVRYQTSKEDFKTFTDMWEAKENPTKFTSRSEVDKLIRDSVVALYASEKDDNRDRNKIFQFSKRVLPEIHKRLYDIEKSTGKKITDPEELRKIVNGIIISPLKFQKQTARDFWPWIKNEPKPIEFTNRFGLSEKTTTALEGHSLENQRKIYNQAVRNNQRVKEIRVNQPTGILIRNLIQVYEGMKTAKEHGDSREYHRLMKLFQSLNNKNYKIPKREE